MTLTLESLGKQDTQALLGDAFIGVCVCGGGVPHSWSQFRGGSTGWGSGLCYSKREEGRDLPGRGRLKTEKETR